MVKKEVTHEPVHRYAEGIGRRKTAVARVRVLPGKHAMTVNGKDARAYFALPRLVAVALAPLSALQLEEKFSVSANVAGGGLPAQADAVRHGLSRALVRQDETLKKKLRVLGYLTRDPRAVERKKPGLKKARRAPQWAKR